MKITPTEILKHLGFDVPEEGVEINPNDAYLTVTALRLVGESISSDSIQESKVRELHASLTGIVSEWAQAGLVLPIKVNEEPSEESLMKLRAMLKTLLKVYFKHLD